MCLGLSLYENFWYDEAYTIGMIQREFTDIIRTTSQDVHPPLYYILLKLFYIFPGMEQLLSVKVFSWLFYLAYLLLGAHICRKHYNRRVECFWLILSGFMSPMIVQATSPRMYTLAIFCVTLAMYMAYLSIKKEKAGYWIGFALVSAMTMWLLVLWRQFSRWAGWESGWSNTIEPFGLNSVKAWVAEWFSVFENPSIVVVLGCVIVFLTAGISGFKYVKRTKDFMSCAGVIFAGVVVVLAIIVTITIVPCFLGRYIFPLFGAVFLFVAIGLDNMQCRWIKGICALIIICCGLFTYRGEIVLENPEGLNNYRAYMDENMQQDELIMADAYFLMMMSIYYPDNDYMIYGAVPACMPFDGCKAFTAWSSWKMKMWYGI